MATLIPTRTPRPELVVHEVSATRDRASWLDWATTSDHKKIGVMYLMATFGFFLLGGTEALLMRTQLAQPDNTLLAPERYNPLVTMHGTTMVFLFVVPSRSSRCWCGRTTCSPRRRPPWCWPFS
jgi:cytochrome c oxidase subunit 1